MQKEEFHADCHDAVCEGGQKFTDHHIQSPLNNITNSCQVCHREESGKLVKDVYDRQDKIIQNRDKLEEHWSMHTLKPGGMGIGASETEMKNILQGYVMPNMLGFCGSQSWRLFHAPIEIGRVISSGIVIMGTPGLSLPLLASKGFNKEVPYPSIETKEKAQNFIGLDMKN